jgi:hypothetical protein
MYSIQDNLFDLEPITKSDLLLSGNDNCRLGVVTEMIFATIMLERGYDVFSPLGHSQKADLIVHKPPFKSKAIQIKKGTPRGGATWQISTSTKKRTAAEGSVYTNYQIGDFDILAAHIAEVDCWALWRIEEVAGKSSVTWNKFETHRNNFGLLDL